ncbi:hypothetical protein [Vibrio spartinae]|uniref:hypothetical protein n=1 Tax=Vibrio spartinae TaxID=1918945 RepID=UPI0011154519|nr:hypothetical protein [Vibrio spartinae]
MNEVSIKEGADKEHHQPSLYAYYWEKCDSIQSNSSAYPLYGSERFHQYGATKREFLSCLCGSERDTKEKLSEAVFLSCLCGSEQ